MGLKGLRNSRLANEKGIALKANASYAIKGTEAGAASSADVIVTFSGIANSESVSFGACVLGNSTMEGLGIAITVFGGFAGIEVGTCGDTLYKQHSEPGYDKWESGWD